MLIYVIEDDLEWQEYYQEVFCNHRVECFVDGIAAMERIAEKLPDFIVVDMLLVGPNGMAVLHELQSYADSAKIPVVVASSATIPDDLSNYGVLGVFDKGKMLPSELLDKLREVSV